MNDPLRDNRIFPEEMQQQVVVPEKKPKSKSWLWNVTGIVLLLVLLVFGYFWYQKSQNQPQSFVPDEITPEEQAKVITALKNSSPDRTIEERDKLILELFNKNN